MNLAKNDCDDRVSIINAVEKFEHFIDNVLFSLFKQRRILSRYSRVMQKEASYVYCSKTEH